MCTSVLYFAFAGLGASAAAPAAPVWLTDYRQARAQAKNAQRPLAVFVGTGKDGFHKVSRDGILSADVQKALARSYVCLYLDVSQANAKKLAGEFQIGTGRGLVISSRAGDAQA